MATLNGLYVFVETEEVTRTIERTSHPVEKGANLTDHSTVKGVEVSLTGKLVGANAVSALSSLNTMARNGTLIKYVGRGVYSDMQISAFDTGHPNTVYGGCTFRMTLSSARIAQSAYAKTANATKSASKSVTAQQVTKLTSSDNLYHTVKKGDTVWKLVNQTYKGQLTATSTVQWVVDNNPSCFSKAGDATSLKVGSKLNMGVRAS